MKKTFSTLILFASCALIAAAPAAGVMLASVSTVSSYTRTVPTFTVLGDLARTLSLEPLLALLPALLLLLVVAFAQTFGARTLRAAGGVSRALLAAAGALLTRRRDPRPPVAGLALLLGLGMARAAGVGEAEPGVGLLNAMLTVLSMAGSLALVFASKYLRGKAALVQGQAFQQVSGVVLELAFGKVAELNRAAIEKLKAAAADGKLSPAEASAALQTAVAEVWASLPEAVRALLVRYVGSEQGVKDRLIVPHVENAVRSAPQLMRASTSFSVGELRAKPTPPSARAVALARQRIGLV